MQLAATRQSRHLAKEEEEVRVKGKAMWNVVDDGWHFIVTNQGEQRKTLDWEGH